jgi:antitoxin component YwqK of YwqJK toxin-antitoxin module
MKKINDTSLEVIDGVACFDGKPFTGIAEAFYEDGSRYYQYTYENGLQHGPTIKWHKDGSFSHKLIMENGKTKKILFPQDLTDEEKNNL